MSQIPKYYVATNLTDHVADRAELVRLLKEYRNFEIEINHDDCRVSYTKIGVKVDARCNLCRAVDALEGA